MNTIAKHLNLKRLIGSIPLGMVISICAGLYTLNTIKDWYIYLNKPAFITPNWIFGPVWTLIYFLMAIAFYNILNSTIKNASNKQTFVLFWVQLTLNFGWTITFFGLRNPMLAFIIIIALIASVCFWIMSLQITHKNSAYLQIPYLLWCCFACVLNYIIIRLKY